MNDLEMTKLCAEAMGFSLLMAIPTVPTEEGYYEPFRLPQYAYMPLHDDAQAMALVKKFELDIIRHKPISKWSAYFGTSASAEEDDLNRAIVECIAKMGA